MSQSDPPGLGMIIVDVLKYDPSSGHSAPESEYASPSHS
eukprot:CAMPEP_0172505544 /NCGR_PEP_ID=MMETSP1066-20121228/187241_1 /TAXON_ID=671091 /ORGANISM="Coscinodiscus wailesii, Strain CCMP2513" /LENGTH=38 /DNA_ID= /DNA_START= /DNA_END= /DNA_ORIENTATION=